MRYDNPSTQAGSVGPNRGHTDVGTMLREIGLLQGTPDAVIEFENFELGVWTMTWDGRWDGEGAGSRAKDEIVYESCTCMSLFDH